MKSTVIFALVFVLSSNSYSQTADAPLENEQQQTIALCKTIAQKVGGKMGESMDMVCEMNTRSLRYWECVDKRVDAGETAQYAIGRCDD